MYLDENLSKKIISLIMDCNEGGISPMTVFRVMVAGGHEKECVRAHIKILIVENIITYNQIHAYVVNKEWEKMLAPLVHQEHQKMKASSN